MTNIEQLFMQLETYPAVYHKLTCKLLEEALEYQSCDDLQEISEFLEMLGAIIDIFNPFFHYDIELLNSLHTEISLLTLQIRQLKDESTN